MNKALLLIDIQNDYFPGGAWELSHVDEAAAQARLALEPDFLNMTKSPSCRSLRATEVPLSIWAEAVRVRV